MLLAGCAGGNFGSLPPSAGANQVKLEGFVHGGQQPIVGSTVQLYAVGSTADQSAATPLIGSAPVTDASGAFSITGLYNCPSITTEVYLIAKGGNPGLAPLTNNQQAVLMAALGPCGNLTSSTHIIINEVTTIGSIYPILPFMAGYLNVGAAPANALTLASDFMQINQYIDTDGGQSPGPQLPGGFTAPVANLNTLANSMAACVNSPGGVAGDGSACGNFLLYAKPPAAPAPTNTADAIFDIANNPTQNVNNIFLLASASPAFQPVLSSAPADWTLKILPNLTLTTPSNLVGVGSPTTGTITLGQAAPAGGLTVNFVSSNIGAVSANTPVVIPAGATTGTFSYIGIAAGTATITASATGYYGSSVTLSSTSSLISLGTIPTVAPGQSVSLPLSLGTPAPAGGVTVNFTSASPSIATVTPSVFIPGGLQIPASNPQVTGVTVGVAAINATATGFAPGSRNASVSVTASFPATFAIPIGVVTNETLTISAPAPVGGITFALTVDNPSIFSVPSTVNVPAGSTTVNVPINGLTGGTTNVRANSTNIPEAVSAVTVNGNINLQTSALIAGKFLETNSYFYLPSIPPSPTTVTLTSSNPAVFTVSTGPTIAGTPVASIPAITGTGTQSFYVQGTGIGSATLTISAPGYNNASVAITVDPSGFAFQSSGFSTTTLSPDTSVYIQPYILNPATLALLAGGTVAPVSGVNVAVASGTPATGTILNSPAAFTGGVSSTPVNFHPLAPGTSALTITQPAGFSIPATGQSIVATVTAPPINLQTTALTTGLNLEINSYLYLSQTPVVPTNITLTSSNPAVAVASLSATTAGTATTTMTNVVNQGTQGFYIQGLSLGTATFTVSAPAFASTSFTVTVDPSGFTIATGNISTTTFSPTSSVYVQADILNPATFTVIGNGSINPQLGSASVPIASATTTVGTIASPVVITAGNANSFVTFQPVGAGTSIISITQPAGFSTPTPASSLQITATVTAPPINEQTSVLTTGVNLEVGTYVYLSQNPPTPVTITVVSSNPAVAVVSSSSTIAGAASTTFPNVVNGATQSYYVQGQSVGTSTITVTAPGYQSTTMTVTVDPSGFQIATGNISTTTFSPTSSVYVQPVILNPATLTVIGNASLNPGISTVNIPIASSAPQVGTITTPYSFTGGSSSAFTVFSPIAAGTTNLSISTPPGFSTPSPAATQQITATVTAPNINIQSSSVTTGVNLETGTYTYLSQNPPSPVTVTVTSGSPSIATVSSSATVAGGASIAFNNISNGATLSYYIQGHAVGTTSLTIAAAGFASNTVSVTVDPSGFIFASNNFNTTTFSSTTNVYVQPVFLSPGTLNVVGNASLAPGIGSVAVPIVSSNTSVGTVTTPITFNPGDSSDFASFQPINAGSSALTISTPAGFSTPSNAATQQITATVTAPPINVQTNSLATGLGLQVATYTYLSISPPAGVTVTLTSSNPGAVLLSKSLTAAGTGTITFNNITNGQTLSYFVQGTGLGSSTITISAPGYSSNTVAVAADPSSFIFASSSFSTTTFSPTTNVYAQPVILAPGVLTVIGTGYLAPGAPVTVPITSSIPGVGTVTTPITFNPGDSSDFAVFQPVGAGSTVLTISTPGGFTVPSQASTQIITATVTAPPINVQTTNLVTGNNLEVSTYTYLSVNPPAPVTVTVTSSNPAVATVSQSATTVGTTSIAFTGIANGATLSYFVQGQSVGTTTLTVSAPGYASTTINVSVDPSGFIIAAPGNFTTTTASTNTTITFQPAILSPGILTVIGTGSLNPGIGTVGLSVGSTSPQIGTLSPGTLNFTAGTASLTATFHPVAVGTTDIVIVSQPAGFTAPSQPITYNITATVN